MIIIRQENCFKFNPKDLSHAISTLLETKYLSNKEMLAKQSLSVSGRCADCWQVNIHTFILCNYFYILFQKESPFLEWFSDFFFGFLVSFKFCMYY